MVGLGEKMFSHQKPKYRPRIVKVIEVKEESPKVKTLIFQDEECTKAKPGQFIMVWVPSVDEIPLSLTTSTRRGCQAITVKEVGEATKALCNKKPGEIIGVRGPYGSCFTAHGKKVLIAAGGVGLIPLVWLAEHLAAEGKKISFVAGARTRSELIFLDRLERLVKKFKVNLVGMTDDGSFGAMGQVSEATDTIIKKQDFDVIYTCGPEKMMKKIFEQAEPRNIPVQASLERIMKCGAGFCGSCCIGRYRVCKDGPVFSAEQLREFKSELGVYRRNHAGRLVKL